MMMIAVTPTGAGVRPVATAESALITMSVPVGRATHKPRTGQPRQGRFAPQMGGVGAGGRRV